MRKNLVFRGAVWLSALALLVNPASASAAPISAKTQTFVSNAFTNGGGTAITSDGNIQWSTSLEALMQRRGTGVKFAQQLKSAKFLLGTTAVAVGASTNPNSGYLYDSNRQLIPALAGQFLAASKSLRVPNGPLSKVVLTRLRSIIAIDGTLAQAPNGSVDYAWAILGLKSQNQTELADKVANKLLAFANSDGGFDGVTDVSSVSATGLAMQALVAVKNSGGAVAVKSKLVALRAAYKFLTSTDSQDSHWMNAGLPDVSGTAEAVMGIRAFAGGKPVTAHQKWLVSQTATDGGIRADVSVDKGDVTATVKSLLPIFGGTYLSAIQ